MSPIAISLIVERAHLEIPIADVEQIALELGCRLIHRPRELTLQGDDGGALIFDRIGPLAMLREVDIRDDEHGLFAVHVLGRLLSAYEGELEARLQTSPQDDVYPPTISVRRGETTHPLFAAVMPPMLPSLSPEQLEAVEALLEEGRAAFAEWLRSKQAAPSESA